MRLLAPEQLLAGLAAALSGGPPVASEPEPRLLGVLRPDLPVTEPDAAALVITSGSTAEPRVVVLTRSGITASVRAVHARLGGSGDWVCALPTGHVAGLMTLARAVTAGTSLTFARPDLSDLAEPGQRTFLSLVPAQLDRALDDPAVTSKIARHAAVLVGGQAVPEALRDKAAAAGVRLVTSYGMSETCGGCVLDGVPLDGVRVELDGERISLGGPMVFAGYRLRPDLTAQVLTGDLVRTNDRGRMVSGRLEVLGRFDDVVLTGGQNVDLAWAQQVCDRAFGFGVVALLGIPDQRWGTRIVALTTGSVGLEPLRETLRDAMGKAAEPRELRSARELAYTSSGKIDRAAMVRSWQAGEYGESG